MRYCKVITRDFWSYNCIWRVSHIYKRGTIYFKGFATYADEKRVRSVRGMDDFCFCCWDMELKNVVEYVVE
jgi:hypothetical protein